MVVGIAGQPVLLELYPSTPALGPHVGQIVTGALLDAIATGSPEEETPARRVRRLDDLSLTRDWTMDAGAATAIAANNQYAVVRGVRGRTGRRTAHVGHARPKNTRACARRCGR